MHHNDDDVETDSVITLQSDDVMWLCRVESYVVSHARNDKGMHRLDLQLYTYTNINIYMYTTAKTDIHRCYPI